MINALYKRKLFVLTLITLLAFALRFYRLDAAGISEDESHKMEAAAAYMQGDFRLNAEHPMLMKSLATATIWLTDWLHLPFSHEIALRLPNVIFGSLTCVVLYLLFTSMFNFRIGLLTSLMWAINLNTILINRVAKEDTLMVFFLWLAFYSCWRAKHVPDTNDSLKKKFYGLTGLNFGLMMASKYFPHYFGVNFLYYHLIGPNKWNTKIKGRHILIVFIVMGIVFFIANPAVLMPGVIKYMAAYAQELKQTHHGYWMMGQLHRNEASNPASGTPFYFYLLALLVKTPVPMMLAFLLGLVEVMRRKEDNYFFVKFTLLLWLIPYSWFGAKFLRYMLSVMPMVCAITAIGLSYGYDTIRNYWERNLPQWSLRTKTLFLATGIAIFIVAPTITVMQAAPFYSLYVSPLAGGDSRIGYYFPHDEFYDLGLREAVQYIAQQAEPNAVIVNEAPGVIKYYQAVFQRPDLKSMSISNAGFQFPDAPTFVVVQDGRRYFENESGLAFVENNYVPVKEVIVRGATAVKIYKIYGREDGVQAQHREATASTLVIQ